MSIPFLFLLENYVVMVEEEESGVSPLPIEEDRDDYVDIMNDYDELPPVQVKEDVPTQEGGRRSKECSHPRGEEWRMPPPTLILQVVQNSKVDSNFHPSSLGSWMGGFRCLFKKIV